MNSKGRFCLKTGLILLVIISCLQKITLQAQTSRNLSFDYSSLSISSYSAEDNNTYEKVNFANLKQTGQPGEPELPVKYLRLIISCDEKIESISLKRGKEKTIYLGNKIFPSQPDIPTSIYYTKPEFVSPKPEIYKSDKAWPSEMVTQVKECYFDGTYHIVTLAICPFQYFPNENKLEVYSDLEFELNTKITGRKSAGTVKRSQKAEDYYLSALYNMVDNPEDISRYYSSKANNTLAKTTSGPLPAYEYVIITRNSLSSAFNKFMDWKRRKGLNIGVVTVEDILYYYNNGDEISGIDDDAGSIRQYLSDSYEDGTVFALLGGDYSKVPIRYGNKENDLSGDFDEIPADIYFADFDGDWRVDDDSRWGEEDQDSPDYGSEIFVGRLLCSNADEISRWTEKVIIYEQNPGRGNYSYLNKSLMMEADEMQNNNCAENIETMLPSYFDTYILKELYTAGSNPPVAHSGSTIINVMNQSYGLWSWFVHGCPKGAACMTRGINNGDESRIVPYGAQGTEGGIDQLTNNNYPAIVYSMSCTNTPFDDFTINNFNWDVGYNLGEAFTVQGSNGGLAFLGNTRTGGIISSYDLYEEFVQLLNSNTTTLGIAEAASKINYSGASYHFLSYTHNLVGCPETKIWTASPTS